jgi:hypothetical protein
VFFFICLLLIKEYLMTSIRSCIEQQLNEIELLRCCYPSTDEFHLDDIEAFNEAKEFMDGKYDNIQRNLCFILKLHLNDIKVNVLNRIYLILFVMSLDKYRTSIYLSTSLSGSTSGCSSTYIFITRVL